MNINSLITEKLLEFFTFNQTGYIYYIAIFVLYIWILFLALGIYVYIDLRKRGVNIVLSIIIALFVFLFNIPGFILYLILRPTKTREEEEWEELERKFISQEIEDYTVCSNCGHTLRSEDMFCVHCGVQHRAKCSCGAILEQDWEFCPQCGLRSSFYKKPDSVKEEHRSFIHFPSFKKEQKVYKPSSESPKKVQGERKSEIDYGKVMISETSNEHKNMEASKHIQPKINIKNDIIEKAVKESPATTQSMDGEADITAKVEQSKKLNMRGNMSSLFSSIGEVTARGGAKIKSVVRTVKMKGYSGVNVVKVQLSTLSLSQISTAGSKPVPNSYVEGKKAQPSKNKKKKTNTAKRKKHKKKGGKKR